MWPGLADPALDSQRIFRALLHAMAHPGRLTELVEIPAAPVPLSAAAAALCLALVDFETPLWLDGAAATPDVSEYLRFHCGAPLTPAPRSARFALIADPRAMPALSAFDPGSDEFPDRSATLVIQVASLAPGEGQRLAGPGIE